MASKYFKLGLKEKSDKLIKANEKRQRAEDRRNRIKPKKIKIKKYNPGGEWTGM
tara:strand:+ start:3123 stop:3284 length:162 start_codon:yes stop_codon:yes gene_type:complete